MRHSGLKAKCRRCDINVLTLALPSEDVNDLLWARPPGRSPFRGTMAGQTPDLTPNTSPSRGAPLALTCRQYPDVAQARVIKSGVLLGVRQIADQCGGRVGVREQLLNESQLTHSRSEQRRTAAALTGTPHSYTENNIPAHPSRRARGEKRHSEWEGKQQKYISGGRRWDTSKRKRQ
ncbi:unnamed protein product [Gadus morhua 'NCC']